MKNKIEELKLTLANFENEIKFHQKELKFWEKQKAKIENKIENKIQKQKGLK